ncbi:hypothetical protein ACVWV0_003968 [Ewingella americana]
MSFYAGWNPAARAPPKRRHFVAITEASETCPFQPCEASITQQKKRRVPREARLRLPWSVWADAHDLEFEFEFEFQFEFNFEMKNQNWGFGGSQPPMAKSSFCHTFY